MTHLWVGLSRGATRDSPPDGCVTWCYTRLISGWVCHVVLHVTHLRMGVSCGHHHHQSLNRDGRWGTTDDFATSFLHFSLFNTALWDLPNSRPVHSLMLSSHLFLCPPCLLPPFTVPCKMVWPDLMNGKHDHTTAVRVFLRSSGDLHVVQLPAGSWHGLPRW